MLLILLLCLNWIFDNCDCEWVGAFAFSILWFKNNFELCGVLAEFLITNILSNEIFLESWSCGFVLMSIRVVGIWRGNFVFILLLYNDELYSLLLFKEPKLEFLKWFDVNLNEKTNNKIL